MVPLGQPRDRPSQLGAEHSDDVAKMHAAVGIKSLYRGVSKEDPSKVCAVQQGPVGVE